MGLAIGVDIGGTKIAAGVVDGEGKVLRRTDVPTPSSEAAALDDAICRVVTELADGGPIAAVGIGAAGWISHDSGIIHFSPHIAWREYPVADNVAHRLQAPVSLDNDANAAAWAEYRFGAARGAKVALCVTVGTGIGGGIIIDGQLYRGGSGLAGEIGHIVVEEGGRPCACGGVGCWEMYASGTALVREARERMTNEPAKAQRLAELSSDQPDSLTGAMVTQAAAEHDQLAIELFDWLGQRLGSGLGSVAATIDPSIIVIGGGVSDADEVLLAPTRATFAGSMANAPSRPPVLRAQLGTAAGLVGAADLARVEVAARREVTR